MVKKPFIYIAGPITMGAYCVNVRNGVDAHKKIIDMGGVPFTPMLDMIYALVYPETTWEQFLEYDFQVIMRCDAMFRLPGTSKGADQEEKFAKEHGIPFFTDWDRLAMWIINYGKKEYRPQNCCGYSD
jgi:hypothetical protein